MAFDQQQLRFALSDENELGKGAFGSVYKATYADQDVVIKIARSDHADNGSIKKESDLLKTIHHPNIVVFFGSLLIQGRAAFVLEFMLLGSLHDVFSQSPYKGIRPYTDAELNWLLRLKLSSDIANGLSFLHNPHKNDATVRVGSIVHKDLKPANVLLSDRWVAKLADFGLSRHRIEHTPAEPSQGAGGTRGWMAPEIVSGYAYSRRSDVFVLGLILRYIVIRQHPGEAETAEYYQSFASAIRHAAVPASRFDDFMQLFLQCVSRDPESRSTAEEVHASISEMLASARRACGEIAYPPMLSRSVGETVDSSSASSYGLSASNPTGSSAEQTALASAAAGGAMSSPMTSRSDEATLTPRQTDWRYEETGSEDTVRTQRTMQRSDDTQSMSPAYSSRTLFSEPPPVGHRQSSLIHLPLPNITFRYTFVQFVDDLSVKQRNGDYADLSRDQLRCYGFAVLDFLVEKANQDELYGLSKRSFPSISDAGFRILSDYVYEQLNDNYILRAACNFPDDCQFLKEHALDPASEDYDFARAIEAVGVPRFDRMSFAAEFDTITEAEFDQDAFLAAVLQTRDALSQHMRAFNISGGGRQPINDDSVGGHLTSVMRAIRKEKIREKIIQSALEESSMPNGLIVFVLHVMSQNRGLLAGKYFKEFSRALETAIMENGCSALEGIAHRSFTP